MPAELYDDWGNPTRPQYKDKSIEDDDFISYIKSRLRSIKPRTILLVTPTLLLFWVLCLWLFGGSSSSEKVIDWKRFAYVQYATDNHNLCNSFMVFEALKRHGSKAERVLLYPREWDLIDDGPNDRNSQLLVRAKKLYNVRLKPVTIIDADGKAEPGTLNNPSSWDTSITKLRAFELDEYARVLHLDSDITLLDHLDELFLLPSAPVAMPRAYWTDAPPSEWPLTSLLMLLEPSISEFRNLLDLLAAWKLEPEYQVEKKFDMDLLNHRFAGSALVLPHRRYALPSAEFRRRDHAAYLGGINGPEDHHRLRWDPDRALAEAKLVHFSDWPLPKPWVMWPLEGLAELQPDCDGATQGSCPERRIWKGLYDDFRKRRRDLCRILSVPAPKWDELKNKTGAA